MANSTLLVLNGTSLNSVNALLVLARQYISLYEMMTVLEIIISFIKKLADLSKELKLFSAKCEP